MKKWIFGLAFSVSVLINIVFILGWIVDSLNAPFDRVGRLQESIPLAKFGDQSGVYVTLPEGLVVRDSSPNFIAAAGMFEPYRFQIEITSDRQLVNWDADTRDVPYGEYYSADSYFDFEKGEYSRNRP